MSVEQLETNRVETGITQPPETRWIQNLRHPSYQLCQPIPIVIERAGDIVTANYDDLELQATGDDLKAAISHLCGEIVAYYEKAPEIC